MPSDCQWRDGAYKVCEYQRERRVNAVVRPFWVVALFALLYRADVIGGERATVLHAVIGRVIQDFETVRSGGPFAYAKGERHVLQT